LVKCRGSRINIVSLYGKGCDIISQIENFSYWQTIKNESDTPNDLNGTKLANDIKHTILT